MSSSTSSGNSFLSLLGFFIISLVYFNYGKYDKIIEDQENNTEEIEKVYSSNTMMLMVYFIAVIVIQIIFSVVYISQLCGGSASQNIGSAFVLTFIPWFFIFGAVIIVILVFPTLKSVFSNVVGYFFISGSVNTLLNELLIDVSVEEKIEKSNIETTQKEDLKRVSDMILKICGNKSIIINEFTFTNFNKMFETLTPLFKEKYKTNNEEEKKKLFHLVCMKEYVGEFCWYFYTAILVSSLVGYNISSRGCSKSAQEMQTTYQDYLASTTTTTTTNTATTTTSTTSTS